MEIKRTGFIGIGNMGEALYSGFVAAGKLTPDKAYAYTPNKAELEEKVNRLGLHGCSTLTEMLKQAELIVIACKPQQVLENAGVILRESPDMPVVCIAAGFSLKKFRDAGLGDLHVQCIMPNTPARIRDGVTLFEEENTLSEEELAYAKDLLSAVGTVEVLPSHLMKVGMAVTSCSPAFVDMMIEAYADAAVKYGIPRAAAYRMVSGTIHGAAGLQIKTGEHPGVLKDQVCSPGGTTIRGVAALEACAFRDACIRSIDEIVDPS